jgi:hypothetical protein
MNFRDAKQVFGANFGWRAENSRIAIYRNENARGLVFGVRADTLNQGKLNIIDMSLEDVYRATVKLDPDVGSLVIKEHHDILRALGPINADTFSEISLNYKVIFPGYIEVYTPPNTIDALVLAQNFSEDWRIAALGNARDFQNLPIEFLLKASLALPIVFGAVVDAPKFLFDGWAPAFFFGNQSGDSANSKTLVLYNEGQFLNFINIINQILVLLLLFSLALVCIFKRRRK